METVTVSLRIPVNLRNRLTKEAKTSGRSLNAEVSKRLDSSLDACAEFMGDFFDDYSVPKYLRMRCSSTYGDTARIINTLRGIPVERVIFAAKSSDLNDAVLVLLMEANSNIFIVDQSNINMARDPRIAEVSELMRAFDSKGLLETAEYCPELVDDTSSFNTEKAVQHFLHIGPRTRLLDLSDYLRLLAQHEHFEPSEFRIS